VFFAGDARTLVTVNSGGNVTLWDAVAGDPVKGFNALAKEAARPEIIPFLRIARPSPDGKLIATGTAGFFEDGWATGLVRLWDLRTGNEGPVLADQPASLTRPVFSPDGKLLAAGNLAGGFILWDLTTGRPRSTFTGGQSMLCLAAFSPDGAAVAGAYVDKTVRLWNVASGKELAAYHGHTDQINWLEFSADGAQLATGSSDNTVKLWDARPNPR
jgi:hypothetical protein